MFPHGPIFVFMEKEIQATVKLWSDQIRYQSKNFKTLIGTVTDEQISLFEKTLTSCLRFKILKSESWDADQPEKGATHRILSVDYQPDQELSTSLRMAGLSCLLLPLKSQTFTCPGVIIYSFGYSIDRERLEIK